MLSSNCYWLPKLHEPDAAFAVLKATTDPAERIRRIVAMAEHQLDFVQSGKLDRHLERTLAELPEPPGLERVRVGWIGSSTFEHLIPNARLACLRRGLLVESYVAAYGQYRQELYDPTSGLAQFRPQIVVLSLDHEEGAINADLGAGRGEVDAQVQQRVLELRQLWTTAAQKLGCVVVQQTIPNLAPPLFGSFDALVPGSPCSIIDRLNRAIVEAAAETRTPVLDVAGWSARLGHDTWFDPVRWLQAKQLVSPTVAPVYGDLLARLVAAIRGRSRKCLVLDLDNTLWGGVIGDDGIQKIVLGHGSAAGEAFVNFQHYAHRLKQRGIVLAVCSKNEHAIAQSAFRDHPDMLLKLEDIAVFVANWQDKVANLKRIAEALNLGLDSLVFFDDNPAERALVRAELPMVAVPEVPEDPAYYVRTLVDAGYFEAVSFTTDDLSRATQYRDNARRLGELESATDMPTFLKGLGMSLTVGSVDATSIGRVTQLINKTNQFNVTTKRYTEPELRSFADVSTNVTLHFRLVDRFGDNGLIAVILAREESRERLVIDTLLMSCRVLGRGVEQAMLNCLVDRAAARGIQEIIGEYVPTAKNAMVSDLFARLGFEAVHTDDNLRGATRWKLRLADHRPHPTFIEIGETS